VEYEDGEHGTHTLTAVARMRPATRRRRGVTVTVSTTPRRDGWHHGAAPGRRECTLTVTAGASDNVGVAGVQFRLDGAASARKTTAAPYDRVDTASGARHAHVDAVDAMRRQHGDGGGCDRDGRH